MDWTMTAYTNTSNLSGPGTVIPALQALRTDFNNGVMTKSQFFLTAAAAYYASGKPLRAKAMLDTIEPGLLTTDQILRRTELLDKCNLPKYSAAPTCSLNMIVKNEEARIGDALESIDSIVDEIVICDTGSADRTVDVAEQYGVIMVFDRWRNDFSRARNKAIDASTGDWIFWMDADDRLEKRSAARLRKIWQSGTTCAAAFCIVNEREQTSPVEFLQVRLFPRMQSVRFEQCIHEQVMYSIARENIPFAAYPNIRIRHTGYTTQAAQKKKCLRNKPMIRAELRKSPNDPVLLCNLGDCLLVLRQYDEALKAYGAVIENRAVIRKNPDVYFQAHIHCANILLHRNDMDKAEKMLRHCIDLDDTRVEAHFALGHLYYAKNIFHKAAACFMESARHTPPLRMTAVDTTKVRLESIYYLVDILLRWEELSAAENLLLPAITINPLVPQYHMLMGKVLTRQNRLQEAARYYTASISLSPENNKASYHGMAEIYQIIGDGRTARQYRKMAS